VRNNALLILLFTESLSADFSLSNAYPIFRILLLFYKYRNPVSDLASKFTNPVLRNLFQMALDWGPNCSAFPIWTLSLMAQGNAGYPMGGSLPLIESVEQKFKTLGGKIHFHSKITRIITENDFSTGIELEDGSVKNADIIISASDGYSTIFNWLGGKYTGSKITHAYQSLKLFSPLVYVSFGINGNFSQEPHTIRFALKKSFRIGQDEIKNLSLYNYSFDPSMAPEGKCVFILMIRTKYEYWERLKDNRELYLAEKNRIGEEVINGLSQLYPGIREKIEVMDVATPLTFVRYTGNREGSYQGWVLDKKGLTMRIPVTLPGLKNFYMAGQWVSPGGGLPSGLITGRNVIRKICKTEKRKFVTSQE